MLLSNSSLDILVNCLHRQFCCLKLFETLEELEGFLVLD